MRELMRKTQLFERLKDGELVIRGTKSQQQQTLEQKDRRDDKAKKRTTLELKRRSKLKLSEGMRRRSRSDDDDNGIIINKPKTACLRKLKKSSLRGQHQSTPFILQAGGKILKWTSGRKINQK